MISNETVYPGGLKESADSCSLKYSLAPGISASEFLRRSKQEEWAIVDARSAAERQVSIIPGALGIEDFEAELDDHSKKNILVYCTLGCRSGVYAQMLRERGFNAFNLWGGVLAWTLEGNVFESPSGDTSRSVHVSGPQWDLLPPDYEAVW